MNIESILVYFACMALSFGYGVLFETTRGQKKTRSKRKKNG